MINYQQFVNCGEVFQKMTTCFQTEGVSVLAHGYMVKYYFHEILKVIDDSYLNKNNLRIPKWLELYKSQIYYFLEDKFYFNKYPNNFVDLNLMWDLVDTYLVLHDCGKPYCRLEDPKTHKISFPDHANISGNIYRDNIGNHSSFADDIEQWIRRDMEIHLLKPEGVKEFASYKFAPLLLISGLAEIHANCEMFGGLESTGFKIKFAQIERRGLSICKLI